MTPQERYESAKRHYRTARDELRAAEEKLRRATAVLAEATEGLTGETRFTSHTRENGNVDVAIGVVDGDMSFHRNVSGHVTVIGMQIGPEGPKTCRWCGGVRGWRIESGQTYHDGKTPAGTYCGQPQ